MDVVVQKDKWVKKKKREDTDQYLARELEKVWDIRVSLILTEICALRTISKSLGKKRLEELEIRSETIQTTTLLI